MKADNNRIPRYNPPCFVSRWHACTSFVAKRASVVIARAGRSDCLGVLSKRMVHLMGAVVLCCVPFSKEMCFADDGLHFMGLSIENDVLGRSNKNEDRNYTMGLQVDWASSELGDSALGVLLKPARTMARLSPGGLFDLDGDRSSNVESPIQEMGFGAVVYTPDNLRASEIIPTERPYASLFYVTISETRANKDHTKAVEFSSTVGLLGLGIAEDVQTFIHREITDGSPEPKGWGNQISNGGEPTFQFNAFSKVKLDPDSNESGGGKEFFQIWAGVGYGLGYRTHATVQIGTAIRLLSPIERKFYQHRAAGVPMAGTGMKSAGLSQNPLTKGEGVQQNESPYRRGAAGLLPRESYLYATMTGSAIAYDVSLQGQFRENPEGVERSSSEIEHFRYFGAAGVTCSWDRFSLGYQYKYESPELTAISQRHEYGLLFFQLLF